MKMIGIILALALMIGIVSAVSIGDYGDGDIGTIVGVEPDVVTFDNNTAYVNSSAFADIWITAEGNKDDVSDISLDELGDVSFTNQETYDFLYCNDPLSPCTTWSNYDLFDANNPVWTGYNQFSNLYTTLGSPISFNGIIGGFSKLYSGATATNLTITLPPSSVTLAGLQNDQTFLGVNTFSDTNYFGEIIGHAGDTDTYWRFLTDRIIGFAGGLNFIYAFEGAFDFIQIGGNVGTWDSLNLTADEVYIVGETSVDGDLEVINNFTGNQIYGEMWYKNYTGTTVGFGASETYYPLYFTEATHENGFSYQGGFNQTSNLTAHVDGIYQINFGSEGSGQNNHEYHLVIFVNNVEQEECEIVHKLSAGGDINSLGGFCMIDLSANDVVDLRIADYTGTGNGVYHGGSVNIVRIGN